jgi:exodeoxyribonuclease VII small subunit
VNIEQALEKLQEITARLDRDDLPLEEAISLFEEGLSLASAVKKQLEEAKLRIDRVVEDSNGLLSVDALDPS